MSEDRHRALSLRLDELETRLERLWSEPELLRGQASWLERLWLRVRGAGRGPLHGPLHLADALRAFAAPDPTTGRPGGEGAGCPDGSSPDPRAGRERWDAHRDAIVDALEDDIERLERAAQLDGEVPAPILTWLFGVHRWLRSMERARTPRAHHAQLALTRGLASRALIAPSPADDPGATIALAGVDALLNEAAQETERVARRRRLLEAARRVLLDAEAAVEGDGGWEARRRVIAQELLQLQRIEAAGTDPRVDVSHQLAARARRQRPGETICACAAVTYLRAGARGVPEAVRELAARLPPTEPSSEGLLPASVEAAVERGYRRARADNERALEHAGLSEVLALQRRRAYLGVDAQLVLLRMALGVDGVFDVGGGLERERVDVVEPIADVVPFPTPELELRRVDHPGGLRDAIIEDPRLLLYHLASRRLLQRRYVRRGTVRRRGTGVRAAVRFYLLDGSTSMGGARARMRDAILVAELATLISRLERPGGRIRSRLYYRYFNSEADITRRVATVADGLEAIEEVLEATRTGRTDIEGALLDSLELIEGNRDDDVELSRAQIVLVTDGEAPVDPALIRGARERLAIPVRVSVIALGAQNEALRTLAAEQRAAGLRVLYHHVGDDRLASWEEGFDDAAWPSFAVEEASPELLDELAALHGAPPRPEDDPEEWVAALREVGLGRLTSTRARAPSSSSRAGTSARCATASIASSRSWSLPRRASHTRTTGRSG